MCDGPSVQGEVDARFQDEIARASEKRLEAVVNRLRAVAAMGRLMAGRPVVDERAFVDAEERRCASRTIRHSCFAPWHRLDGLLYGAGNSMRVLEPSKRARPLQMTLRLCAPGPSCLNAPHVCGPHRG